MATVVQILAPQQQQSPDCTLVVLKMQYERSSFEVLVESKPQVNHNGSLAEACRSELHKLFDGLMDWELSGGTFTEHGAHLGSPRGGAGLSDEDVRTVRPIYGLGQAQQSHCSHSTWAMRESS
jgi:hypothetical protein